MTVWFHLPTTLNLPLDRRLALRVSCILLLCIALITTLFLNAVSYAAPGVNQTIGFQGRLLDSNGDIVHDGYYNIQFKVYQGGSGEAANNPDGTLKWTETYINNGNATGAVEVKNGFMSVNLGSLNPFGNSIDWNQDTLWLSMNIAGAATGCTTFGSGACVADGEMLPMKRMTATPYALNAGAVNGKTADNFIQLAQGVQTDASTNTSSIFINKTSTGNLIQLQNTATDVFTVNNDGDLKFGNNADHSLSVATSDADTDGRELAINAGAGGSGSGSNGGGLSLQGGAAGGTNGDGGNIEINAGAKTGTGADGTISIGTANGSAITIGSTSAALNQNISIGTNNTVGSTSNVTIGAGESANSGATIVQAKDSVTIKTDGITRATFSDSSNTVYFGNGVSASAPNDFTLQGTNSSATGVAGGSLSLQGGQATTGDANGGNITLGGGAGSGTGASGLVVLNTPTFSTVSNDANCYTSGAVVANSCTITTSSINNSAAVIVGFSATGKIATLPDPTITTAGRIIYVTAANGSKDFTLAMNGGGNGNQTTMRQNTTTTILWNGSDWTIAGASNYGVNTTDDIENVQIGSGSDDSTTTLLTVDKAASAPTVTDEALLGSMYYDTTVGKLQCYEADGWGACSSSPDSFVTLSPEYANAVKNGNGIGTMSSDLCSDTLNINDGSDEQPTVCGTNETYNFYSWTSAELADQKRSIYVTYQLPSNFKEFVSGSTSLMGRTDNANSTVNYQVYKNTGSGLAACGAAVAVSTGAQTTWQKAVATSTADPSTCGFAAGDSVVFRINLTASVDANAYASNLNFAFSNL
ncbi:MAG: exported protein of unknown function [Candidatus Saccharibacteria bacterium]|nr:exported protein of unknown function [Candidatus Saccharibacteria bacterium]